MDRLLVNKYAAYTDEQLREIIATGEPTYTSAAVFVATRTLKARGWTTAELQVIKLNHLEKQAPSPTDKATGPLASLTPFIVIGIVLLTLYKTWILISSNLMDNYYPPLTAWQYLKSMYYILFQVVAVGLIYYFGTRLKNKYVWLWVALASWFGALVLLLYGFWEAVRWEAEEKKRRS